MAGRLVWCIDTPGFGGAEINLLRVLGGMCADSRFATGCLVLHADRLAPELEAGLDRLGIEHRPIFNGRNAWRDGLAGLRIGRRTMSDFPSAAFVIWCHHADSNRWLALALALARRRFVVVEQIIPSGREAFTASRLSVPIKRFVMSRAIATVINRRNTQGYRDVFGETGRIVSIPNSRPIDVIGRRVAELRRTASMLRLAHGIHPGEFVVVCVARLEPEKAQDDLIRAIGLLRESSVVRLVLVGSGSERERLRQLAHSIAPGRVLFTDYVPDPLGWLAAADAFVLPSRMEGLAGVLLEAMAGGVPCIVSDIEANRELVEHERTGLVVPVNAPEALAAAIGRLAADPFLVRRCVEGAAKRVQVDYDEAREFDAWRALMGELA